VDKQVHQKSPESRRRNVQVWSFALDAVLVGIGTSQIRLEKANVEN
jgi:hypothetical protein